MPTTTTYPFTTAGNYTASDDDLAEVTEGSATLVDQRPANAIFGATYTTDSDGNWGEGTLTATETGTPDVSSGILTLSGAEQVSYAATSNVANTVGAIRMRYIPNYSGNPSTIQYLMRVETTASNNDYIEVRQSTNGFVVFLLYDESGVKQVDQAGSHSFTAGTEYDIEINFDGSTGASAIYVDGSRKGSLDTSTFTRSMAAGTVLRIGSTTVSQDFSVSSIVCYDAVQHSDTFTPDSIVPPETIYSVASPSVLTNTSVAGGLRSFSATEVTSGSDTVTYAMRVSGVDMYWDGTIWTTSSSSSQANTAADVNTYLPELDTGGAAVKIKAYLNSSDGSTTPTIDELSITYDAVDVSATEPTKVFLEGWLYDHNGPKSGQLVEVRPVVGFANSEAFISHAWETFDTTEDDGYFAGFIWESATVAKQWEFRFGTKKFRVTVPDQATAKWSDLTITAVTE